MVTISEKCKKCRALGQKLFLKGDKCFSPKCPMVKRPYPPGQHSRKRSVGSQSEYKQELSEKQKLRLYYQIGERQFYDEVKKVLKMRGKVEDVSILLFQSLESRLDNVIYRANFASSRRQARQLVTHGYFLLNGKPVNKPAIKVKKGDKISIRENKKNSQIIKNLQLKIKNLNPPSWMKVDKDNLTIEIVDNPQVDLQSLPPINVSLIFEFYSR
jgi:small subunit ribosomal protein S4